MSAAAYTNKIRVQAIAKNTKVNYQGNVANPDNRLYMSTNCQLNFTKLTYYKPNCNPISNISCRPDYILIVTNLIFDGGVDRMDTIYDGGDPFITPDVIFDGGN